jgi:hypothetical protein
MKLSQLKKALLPILGFGLLAPAMHAAAFPLPPRVSITGLAGSDYTSSGDGMVPLVGDADQIWYGDVQGRYGEKGTWMGSLGTGYRRVVDNARILGGYVFIDRNESERGNHFWLASPGIESLGNDWDFRVNGYIPISSRQKDAGTVFADDLGDCQFVNFTGHQQFDHLFDLHEEVNAGVGFDGEIGRVLPFLMQTRAYVGGYHFQFKDSENMNGVSGRLEYPAMPHVNFIASDNYDNIQHNTVLIGVRLSAGGFSNEKVPTTIEERILDPITRNLGSQDSGTGVPILLTKHDEDRNVLERDNIYFFTANDGNAFVAANTTANCTFEHPCTGGSWSQTTVDSINGFAPNTNFYFNSGTYTNVGTGTAPNATVSLNNGQSMYGRSATYRCPANGNERPLLLGGFNLIGNNILDSLRVLNSSTRTTTPSAILSALNIDNAPNIKLNNDDIRAEAIFQGNMPSGNNNRVVGIALGSNSQIWINHSNISASAVVTGNNGTVNSATGIGKTAAGSANISNNAITINNSIVTGAASIGGDNNSVNFANGIGGSLTSGVINFQNNIFTINNSIITGATAVAGNSGNGFRNLATGIGGNGDFSSMNFIGNTFIINNSNISGTASVSGNNNFSIFAATGIGVNGVVSTSNLQNNTFTIDNSTVSGTTSIGGNSASGLRNFATGIGGNGEFGSVNFSNNSFFIKNSNINGTASVSGTNSSVNSAAGIGGNSVSNGVNNVDFANNTFVIKGSQINGTASVGGDNVGNFSLNTAAGIGGNTSGNSSTATFTGNTFTINDSSINGAALIGGNSTIVGAVNLATGIGGNASFGGDTSFIGNIFTINNSIITGRASVFDNNSLNFATGIGGNAGYFNVGNANFTNNTFTINQSNVSGTATVLGNNFFRNYSAGIGGNAGSPNVTNANFDSNNFTINNSVINGNSSVAGNNSLLNLSTGMGGNASGPGPVTANFTNDTVTINNSNINTTAEVVGTNNAGATNQATGLKADLGSVFNVNNSTVTTRAIVGTNAGSNTAQGNAGTGTFNTPGTVFNTQVSP